MTAPECTIDSRSAFKSTPLGCMAVLSMQNDNEFFCVNKSPVCEISGICIVVSCYCCLFLTFEKGIGCV